MVLIVLPQHVHYELCMLRLIPIIVRAVIASLMIWVGMWVNSREPLEHQTESMLPRILHLQVQIITSNRVAATR